MPWAPRDLPAGLLSLATPELVFEEIEHRGRLYNAAWIPTDRIEDFVSGEGQRNHTRFFIKHREYPSKPKVGLESSH